MSSSTDNAHADKSMIAALGAGPANAARGDAPDAVENVAVAECWRLLGTENLGRLAITARDGAPDIIPLNYAVHEGTIYFRSAPGSKLAAIVADPVVAFEVDGVDAGLRWSVIARGQVRRLNSDQEIRESGVKRIASSSPTAKYNYFGVEPSAISGRRFVDGSDKAPARHPNAFVRPPIGAQEPTRPVDDTVMRSRQGSPGSLRPLHIAHFPPR